ncbi:hypothetical protein K435DRAFT_874867 [Dendrothele bispora CBS 962.96]|uniref:Uncharacterized protein n=1 Tax=Dendrothele bispora (strain CBS 962.96) TaxID=1314807 RepID=A0A4S8KVK7_DENBC|nr:hypothetical protein K435DRAFT_874867 [Dendrothele bispora CBS 962.96]
MYLHSFLCLDHNIPPLQLCPNSNTTSPPEGFTFPKAPVYYRNKTSDLQFRRSYFYSCSVSTDQAHKDAEKAHLNLVVSPPEVIPAGYDQVRQSFDMDPIQGMIEMPLPGVSFVVYLDNDPNRLITMACFQTMESLSFYHEFPRIRFLVDSLWSNTWGNRHELPFYKLGLKHNARSSKPVEGSAAGSYSLGVTVGEGQGKGIVQPAVQLTTPAFVLRHHRLLVTLHELFRLIVPLCISKLEWDVTNVRAEELNVFCTGGLAPAHSSVQKNVSPGRKGGSLIAFIGIIQGKWHSDSKDDKNHWTLLVVFLRIPPGSAAGDFLLARPGLYARAYPDKQGHVVFFLLFKGNDLHTGTAPTTDDDAWKTYIAELEELYKYVGDENRVVYVLYPSHAAFHRDAGIAVSAKTGYDNADGSSSVKTPHTFADDGFPILGGYDDWKCRLAREHYIHQYNSARAKGLQPDRKSWVFM